MQPHVEHFITRHHEMDWERRLRVQCLCNHMEEAAGVHAALLGVGIDRLNRDNLAWVLAKMRLNLMRRPGPQEAVRVATWPVSVERLQFRRDFILYGHDDTVLATAVTQWVVIDTATRRLGRLPAYVAALQTGAGVPGAEQDGDIRIPPVGEDGLWGPVFPVRLADIDQNRHVNNGRYVDFALEAADVAGCQGELKRLDIVFKAEGLRGDTIASRSMPDQTSSGSIIHSLYRQQDGTELARARTVFHAT